MTEADLRARLERKFRHDLNVEVSGLVLDVEPRQAEAVCFKLSAELQELFAPDWVALRANDGGMVGHHTADVQAKADWLAARLDASPDAERLHECWREWAGYQLTLEEFHALRREE